MTRNLSILLVAVLLGACGGNSLCQRFADDAEACGVETTDEQMEQCEDDMAACSKDDEKALIDFFDCLEDEGLNLMSCEDTEATGTGTGFDDFAAMMACYALVSGVSEECAGDFLGETSYTLTSSY